MHFALIEEARRAPQSLRRLLPLLLAVSLLLPGFLSVSLPLFAPQAHAATRNMVQVLSLEHSIDFGKGIDVTLDAEVAGQVTEVRAVYVQLGDRRVSSYGYADFTQDGSTVHAQYRIDTGVSAYYPPGTEFEVHFELTSADGGVESTDSSTFLYLDPAHDWQELSREGVPLDIYYYGFSSGDAGAIADRIAASWQQIAASVGADPATIGRFRAVIYPNVQEFTPAAPATSAASSDGYFFGGFAMHEYHVFLLAGPSPGGAVHELTHLLVDSVVTSPLSPGVPSWLHEGLAQFFEAGSSDYYTRQLTSAARSNNLVTLHNRNTVPALQSELGLFYAEVGSFVGSLVEDQGTERMAQTLQLINSGKTAADAVETAYGKPLWQLENDWRVRLGAEPLPAPAGEDGVTVTPVAGTPQVTGTPQAQATATQPADGPGVTAGTASDDGGGFNWTGPLIGAIAAAVVFIVWSVMVNRRRFRRRKR